MAKHKPTRYLIETSALEPALLESTAAHRKHYAGAVADGTVWSSTYIRKELIARWVCDFFYMASVLRQCASVQEGFRILRETFSIRALKVYYAAIAEYLSKRNALENTKRAAEELVSLAVRRLKLFDKKFRMVSNTCRCEIGDKTCRIDFDHAVDDAVAFAKDFEIPIQNCKVNDFLQLGSDDGRAPKLLQNSKLAKLTACKHLATILAGPRHVTCTECSRIGDVVFALEQPDSHWLVHIDAAYDALCSFLGRRNKKLKSLIAVEKESGKQL
jgi:hypothetical protein